MFAPMAFRMDCNILLSDDTMGFIISKYYFYIYTSIACPTTRLAQQAVDYTGGWGIHPPGLHIRCGMQKMSLLQSEQMCFPLTK